MTKAQNLHAKRLRQLRHPAPTHAGINLRRSLINGNPRRSNGHLPREDTTVNGAKQSSDRVIGLPDPTTNGDTLDHDTSIPRTLAMSKDALEVKAEADVYDKQGRRSLRQQLVQQRDDPDLELYIKLRNIRKKLNWKTNKPLEGQPPHKRARLDELPCTAHLTIWARNPGTRDDAWQWKYSATEQCEMVRGSADVDPVKGRFIQLKMDSAFRVPKKMLRLEVKNGHQRSQEMAQKYFMEIKIVPARTDADWPPIPLLTRPAVESQDLEARARITLQDCLVASYQKLPEPPGADTPLSMCFLKDLALETKYGLELEAKWAAPDPNVRPKVGSAEHSKLESWMRDEEGKPFGRTHPTKRKSAPQSPREDTPTARSKGILPPVPPKPLVIYKFDPRTKRESREFRSLTIDGLACQVCSGRPWKTVEELLLHLENMHHQFKFCLEMVEVNSETNRPEVTISIERVVSRSRKETTKEEEVESLCWVAPEEPFDINKHVIEEDKSWTSRMNPSKSRKSQPKAPAVASRTDVQTERRKKNHGHLPHGHVQPFRPQEYQRKRFPLVRLRTQRKVDSMPYTSISHRATVPEDADEDARSETDDEMDDGWFVAHYLEELDIRAREENWSTARHKLAKKWDYHVLHRERTVHSRYMSDCLVRFIRMERSWVLGKDVDETESAARIAALMELVCELREKRAINDSVCADVAIMVTSNQVTLPEEETAEIEAQSTVQQNRLTTQTAQDALVTQSLLMTDPGTYKSHPRPPHVPYLAGQIPPDVCSHCGNTILSAHRAVSCSNLDCSQTGLWWHAKCAKLDLPGNEEQACSLATQRARLENAFMKERMNWRCGFCKAPSEEKGKQAAL